MIWTTSMSKAIEHGPAAKRARPSHARRPDPLLVFGAPRSGTTYLENLLNSHPEVFLTHETRVFTWLHHSLQLTQKDPILLTEREAFVTHLRRAYPDLIRDFYEELGPGVTVWGDKNPHYANPHQRCLETVVDLFPGSLFIHLVRDGRDVTSSMVRKFSWATLEHAHETWAGMVDRGWEFGNAMAPDRFLSLRYEDLIADDAAAAADLFAFIGLDMDPAVAEFCAAQQTARTSYKEPTRDLTRGAEASDWTHVFTPEQRVSSLELIGSQLIRHGYETEESLAALQAQTAEEARR
jgi:hypothetical protein